MSRPIVVSDMDGTLTSANTWRGVQAWIDANHRSSASRRFVWVRLPIIALARLGISDRETFRDRWLRDQARLLRGLTSSRLTEMGEWVVEQHLWPTRRQAAVEALAAEVQAAREAHGAAELLIASAAFQPVADAFARRLGADAALATPLEMRAGIATGGLAAPVQSGELKAAAIRAHAGDREVLAAFGDSAGDVPLLALARRAVAVAPDAALRRAATARDWEILELD